MARGQFTPARQMPQQQSGHSQQLIRQESLHIQSSSTPPPAHVEAYERILPGATGRFLALAESEAIHRRTHENAHLVIVQDNAAYDRTLAGRGQAFAFIIAILAIGGAVYLGAVGSQWTGSVIGGGSLVAIIIAFLRGGRKANEK